MYIKRKYFRSTCHQITGMVYTQKRRTASMSNNLCFYRVFVRKVLITVQRDFRARFRKDAWCVFSKPCTKLTLHCNHRSGHLKTEHTENLFLLGRHLGNWPRGPAVSMRSELLVAHEKLG